jgi:hypothetical protein
MMKILEGYQVNDRPNHTSSVRNPIVSYQEFDSSNYEMIKRDLADYGFCRLRDQLFDAVRSLWQRRIEEGRTFDDIANRLGRSKRWVRNKYSGPGQWTLRAAGELICALDGEAEIQIPGLEDPIPGVRLGFGDVVRYGNDKLFVIGDYINSVDNGRQIVVGANSTEIGYPVYASACKQEAAGYHSFCRDLQKKYLEKHPGNIKGF